MKKVIRRLASSNKGMLGVYVATLLLYLISIILFDFSLLKLAGIENMYRYITMIILILILIWIIFGIYKFLVKRKKTKFIIAIILTVLLSIILIASSYFINMVYGEINKITEDDKVIYTSYLISLSDKEFNSSSKIAMIKDDKDIEGNILAVDLMDKYNLDNDITFCSSYSDMLVKLFSNQIDAIFVSGNYVTLFQNDYENIASTTKILYKLSKTMNNKDSILKSSKKMSEPFTILLMGVDTDSSDGVKTNSSFNGDTLMLISFNPKTLNATALSIPRDLYVPISCRRNVLNKINSSAAGGTSCVIDTIENIMDIPIDYYAKINFQGVVDLVNAVGGVDLEVKYPFCEQDSHRSFENEICLKVGSQHINGEEALAFARHRHTLPGGDLTRIQNQQILVEALAQQMIQLNSLSKVKDVISAISNNISVNMGTNQILSSYNILKSMLMNTIKGKDALNLNKTYLEVYDKPVYLPNGRYLASLGYYDKSLDKVKSAMKVNLELEKPVYIKSFSYDANTTYEKVVPGKNIKTSDVLVTVPDFTGKSISMAEVFCRNNNLELAKEYVKSESSNYNKDIRNGLIGGQSLKSGSLINNISKITIYINSLS